MESVLLCSRREARRTSFSKDGPRDREVLLSTAFQTSRFLGSSHSWGGSWRSPVQCDPRGFRPLAEQHWPWRVVARI